MALNYPRSVSKVLRFTRFLNPAPGRFSKDQKSVLFFDNCLIHRERPILHNPDFRIFEHSESLVHKLVASRSIGCRPGSESMRQEV